MRPILTIGYPTYGRADSIEAAITAALPRIAGLPIELLVADNCSPDGTVERLTRRFWNLQLRVISGDENRGWKGNIARLVENSRSDFLLLLSDEDDVAEPKDLAELLVFLSGPQTLSLVTTGKRPNPQNSFRISAGDLWESVHYISGTVFRTSEISRWLDEIDSIQRSHDVAEL